LASFVHGEKRLAFTVHPEPGSLLGRWSVVAITTSGKAVTADEILEDHGHKILGVYPSLLTAIETAESFATAWVRGYKATTTPDCECDEIPSVTDVPYPVKD